MIDRYDISNLLRFCFVLLNERKAYSLINLQCNKIMIEK